MMKKKKQSTIVLMSSFLQAVRNSEFYSGNRKKHLAAALL